MRNWFLISILILALAFSVIYFALGNDVSLSPVRTDRGAKICNCFEDITWKEECKTADGKKGTQEYKDECLKIDCQESKQGDKICTGILKGAKTKVGSCVPNP